MTRIRSPGRFLLLVFLALSSSACLFAAANADLWDAPSASISLEDAWMPLTMEMGHMAAVNSMPQFEHHMTDRELFDFQTTMTGQPQIQIGLNLICSEIPTIYWCRPTHIPGVQIILNPDTAEGLAALGNVILKLHPKHGSISFSTTAGVTFSGGAVGEKTMVGSLAAINGALASLTFTPEATFFGWTTIDWKLSNDGPSLVNPTNGALRIAVGSQGEAPPPYDEDNETPGDGTQTGSTGPNGGDNGAGNGAGNGPDNGGDQGSEDGGRPSDGSNGQTNNNKPLPKLQPNGLPWGVVRASMVYTPSASSTTPQSRSTFRVFDVSDPPPVISDMAAFKAGIMADTAKVVNVHPSRLTEQAVSTSGSSATVIWDFLAANPGSTTASQDLYDYLVSLQKTDVQNTVFLKDVDLESISQLCEDGEYRHQCSEPETFWSKWELPIIIGACCLVVVCCIGSIIFACVKCRRSKPSGKLAVPPIPDGELAPAKKFVYTAPNGENGPEESISEVTIRPQGEEFEPSHHSVSGSAISEDSQVKNRLAAKFPNKTAAFTTDGVPSTPMDSAVPEQSRSSHHFYYVDESKASGISDTPSHSGSRRLSRHGESSAHFTIEGSTSREISTSQSRSASVISAAESSRVSPPISRKNSLSQIDPAAEPIAEKQMEKEKDKAALPVLRPSRSPKSKSVN